ncbi:MAG: HAMP domain-containing histidine kinase [Desulfobulbaceae bacterium]|uniref:histidine kinase n=1 Tax=Candidatus Desulfobia pelagia TaxID=2841692 RepID=A0A8J6TBL5_9BACT|nr:HAMP domain-containing histidine kinase [Candidatus Desulfobia pelagia]
MAFLDHSEAHNSQDRKIPALFHYLPGWKGNLFLFILLILCSLGYFYYQMVLVNKSFQKYSSELAIIVSGVVRLNIETTVLSQQSVEEIMEIFLGNSADFVGYLDAIEPLSTPEITAFSEEARLAGIRLVRDREIIVDGPVGWLPEDYLCSKVGVGLQHLADQHMYTLSIPSFSNSDNGNGCIVIGMPANRIEELREKSGLDTLISSLTGLPGIEHIRIVSEKEDARLNDKPTIKMVAVDRNPVAETRLSLGDDTLIVGFDARRFSKRIKVLRREFFLFITVLGMLGSFFSWLLYRYQAAEKRRTRDFERRLARQHEEASLGRAAATIAHEVRNPLNAISIGLQRLQLEAAALSPEHHQLLHSMETAVQRTNRIVSDLQKYTRAVVLNEQKVNITEILKSVVTLYDQQCRDQGVEITGNFESNIFVKGDPELLGQVFENLVKNAIEAQPDGGFLQAQLLSENEQVTVVLKNRGVTVSDMDFDKITEPYFTTKTKGCGLGLAISKRIVEAHDGRMVIETDVNNATFIVTVQLRAAD